MDTKKNMSREQLLAYMRDNCTEAEAQQVRMWLRERLKDPGLDQLFSDLLDATETEYDPEGKERVRRKLDSILAACPAPHYPPPPPPYATAIRAGFGAIHAEKSPRGGRNSLGAWHFGVIFLTEDKRGAEGLQGCCLGQARLRTTSQSHSVRQLP